MSPIKTRAKGAIALVVAGMLAIFSAVYAAPRALAAPATVPQLEVVTSTLFDGTSLDSGCDAAKDPADGGGAGVGTHSPGKDCAALNGVVRSWDLFSARADWDVNELDSKDVTLTMTLVVPSVAKADVQFAPDQTGMFTGCLAGSAISADGLTLTCKLGDVAQGTHGTIRPVVRLKAGVDGTKINLNATVKDASGSVPAVATPLVYTVSEAPSGNWVKASPVITPQAVTVDGQRGYVVMFPIVLTSSNQTGNPARGSGPIVTTTPLTFYDHAWKVAKGATLATPAQIAAAQVALSATQPGTKIYGDACGAYNASNAGPYPVTQGTWTCSPQMTSPAPQSYPVWKVTVSGYSATAPATGADGKPNTTGIVLSGQIVLWMDAATVDADFQDQATQYQNTITSDTEAVNVDPTKTAPGSIPVYGNNVTKPEPSIIDNTTAFAITTSTGGGSSGGGGQFFNHYGLIGLQRSYQYRTLPDGTVQKVPYVNLPNNSNTWWTGKGTISRGAPVQMSLFVGTNTTRLDKFDPIQGCMRWDPTQVYLAPMSDILVQNFNTVTGAVTYASRPASDNFGDLLYGVNQGGMYRDGTSSPGLVDLPKAIRDQLGVHVEYGYDTGATTYSDDVGQNAVECNNAATRVWVDSKDTAGMAARKLANGTYKFDMVRVRIDGPFPWATDQSPGQANGNAWYNGPYGSGGFWLAVNGRIGTDLEGVNPNGKSVYIHTSRAHGAWDPTAGKATTQSCEPDINSDDITLEKDPSPQQASGWCNQAYRVANENATATYTLDNANFSATVGGNPIDSDTDRLTIVQASPLAVKTNDAGVMQIANNGQLVKYTIKLSSVGSKYEALTNVTITDALPTTLQFVSLDKAPSTPGSYCTLPSTTATGGNIVCQLSQPDPLKPIAQGQPGYGLPLALPGGEWTDEIKITVLVKGAVASTSTYKPVTNVATLASAGLTPWDPATNSLPVGATPPYAAAQNSVTAAESFLPLASDEAAIVKTVDPGLGNCTAMPDGVPLTGAALAAWSARCTIIPIDPNAGTPTTTDSNGNMKFTLSYSNKGNTKLTNLRMVDVLPYNGDGTLEPGSNSAANGAIPSTVGDARTPGSAYHGKVGLVSVTGASTTWATNGDPKKISRDADAAINQATWCVQSASNPLLWEYAAGPQGACPAGPFDITALYMTMPDLLPSYSVNATVTLDTEGSSCNDLWTNTFGLRSATIKLPIRSNDVSVMAGCQSVGDFVWLDTNRNGLQDNGEPPMAGVVVNLYDATDTLIGTTKTDAAGYYSFQSLIPAAKYTIEFKAPAGSSFTKQNASGDASNAVTDNTDPALAGTDAAAKTHGDSDADPTTGKVTFTTSSAIGKNQVSNPAAATIADNPGIDAGIVTPPVSVGDYVWIDVNRNGQQDAGEPGIPGVTVNLYAANGTTLIATTKTDANGYYAFANLFGGQGYVVEFVKPAGTTFTTPLTGAPATDSNANQSTGRANITAPLTGKNEVAPGKADDPTFDAGIVQLNLLLAKKLTTPAPWVPGQQVSFELSPSNEGPADALAGWSVTDLIPTNLTFVSASGAGYTCVGGKDSAGDTVTCTAAGILKAGATGSPITVNATIKAYVQGDMRNVAYVAPSSKDITETKPLVIPTRTTDTTTTATDNDAQAVLRVNPTSIGDYVWWDVNRDGKQQANENPVPNVVVTLYLKDGVTKVAETKTDAKGFYSFTGLAPNSDYVVVFTKPDGTLFTTQTAGDNRAIDSNPDLKGVATVHTPNTGNNSATTPDDPTIDAGLVKMNLTLIKKVTSGTAKVQQSDTITFALIPHNDGPTDALGGWSVTDLLPAELGYVSAKGDGYTCTTGSNAQGTFVTCVGAGVLRAGADGPTITLVTKVATDVGGKFRNVAYVTPADKDIPETNPLVVPNRTTDTTKTPTDNDADAPFTITGQVPDSGVGAGGLLVPMGILLLVVAGGVLFFGRRRIGVTQS